MDPELRDLLAGVNQEALTILADNDICSVDDAKRLSKSDLDNLGIKLGSRNRILTLLAPALSSRTGIAGATASTICSADTSNASATA